MFQETEVALRVANGLIAKANENPDAPNYKEKLLEVKVGFRRKLQHILDTNS